MPEPVVVVGGSVAALAAADGLAARGVAVRLIAPTKGLGGGFRALQRDGRRLELGVRLLELGYEDDREPPALEDYAPGVGGHRPYTRLVRRWVEDLAGDLLAPIAPPEMVLGGRRAPDVAFSVDLTGLRAALSADELAAIAAEAGAARAREGDAGVLGGPLGDLTLEEASRRNHGATFHERVIAPLAAKFVPGGATTTLAAWRRKAWMPLFWPRTLHEAASGDTPAFRPDRAFETLRPGGCGILVDRLLARLGERGVVAEDHGALAGLEPVAGGRTRLRFTDGTAVDAVRPVVGVAPEEVLVGFAPTRVRSVIAWLAVDEDGLDRPADLLHVHDAEDPVARISRGAGDVWTVELRHDLPEAEIAAAAQAGLARAGIVLNAADARPITQGAMPTFAVPDRSTRDLFARTSRALADRELDLELVGGALDPAADALNEQVVQALRTVERRT